MAYTEKRPSSFLTIKTIGTTGDVDAVLCDGGTRATKLNTDSVLGSKSAIVNDYKALPRIVRYGADSLMCQRDDGIYTSTNGGATWTLAHAFTSPTTVAPGQATAIVPVFDSANGVLLYCGVFRNTSNILVIWKWNPLADTFAEVSTSVTTSALHRTLGAAAMLDGVLYFPAESNYLYIVDFINGNASRTFGGSILSLSSAFTNCAFFIRGNELYVATMSVGGTPTGYNPIIHKWNGSSFTAIIDTIADEFGQGSVTAQVSTPKSFAAFYDPQIDRAVVLWWVDDYTAFTGLGLAAAVVDLDAPSYEDVSPTVIPPEWRHYLYPGGTHYYGGESPKTRVWYDMADGVLAIYVWIADDPSNSYYNSGSVYQYLGIDQQLKFIGYLPSIGADTIGIGTGLNQNCYFYNAESKFVFVYNRTSSGGSQTLAFRAYGGGTIDLKFFFTTGGDIENTQCSLTGTPSSGSLNGNTLEGATADGTEQTVTWQIGANQVGNETPVRVIAVEV